MTEKGPATFFGVGFFRVAGILPRFGGWHLFFLGWRGLERAPRRSFSMAAFDRITCDPNVLGGKACVRGLRISVALLVNLIASGMAPGEILAEYPSLEPDDITQALHYVAWLAEETVLPSETAPA